MHPIIRKTLGGLALSYYMRHLLFSGVVIALLWQSSPALFHPPAAPWSYAWLAVSALLYPYSRFSYEGMITYILGNNLFVLPAIIMLFTKFITMTMCFILSPLIAPLGLAWLYWYHSRQERLESENY